MKSSKFQIILTSVFGVFIVVGVGFFAFSSGGNKGSTTNVLMWGTMSNESFYNFYYNLPIAKDKTVSITYEYKKESDFDKDFVEALASGSGPDIIFLSQDQILRQKNKLYTLPFQSYPERTYRDTYIQEGELFLTSKGILAFPVSIDPMVLYWNRDIFSSNGTAQPPKFWDEISALAPKLTKRDGALNITKSMIALGEYQNITNAKEIISTLIMQAGNPIVSQQGGAYIPVFSSTFNRTVAPAVSAVDFYTEFSNSSKVDYSWNRSLPESQAMFLSGDLAMYLGFASEFDTLKLKNPNLNFDVAQIPQSRSNNTKVTFGKMKALAVTKNTKSPLAAFTVIYGLSIPDAISAFSQSEKLPPVRLDLITKGNVDPNQTLFYQSALWSKAWFDPDKTSTDTALKDMIESITGGRERTSEAVSRMDKELIRLMGNIK
jgi:ABC-type glycerol-3-phosphate transport system substrate-binding protein